MKKTPLYFVAGPTASGKSALAVEIAKQEDGTVINADAMQVYQGLPLLTAQPDPALRAAAPHEMYEIVPPTEIFSVARWREMATETLQAVRAAGRTPVLVGGTGLYFKALLEGLAEVPSIPPSVRRQALDLYNEEGPEAFQTRLAALDPEAAARLPAGDRQRLVRAYEVARYTGRPLTAWQKDATEAQTAFLQDYAIRPLLILPPRDKLYAACNARFEAMITQGALNEVEALLTAIPDFLDHATPATKILGLRDIAAFLRNDVPMELVLSNAQQATRNYAKRQITWFRNQWKETPHFPVKILQQGPI